ncbi:hypothetical protein MRX96_037589 [Rhipicephalus microplus]
MDRGLGWCLRLQQTCSLLRLFQAHDTFAFGARNGGWLGNGRRSASRFPCAAAGLLGGCWRRGCGRVCGLDVGVSFRFLLGVGAFAGQSVAGPAIDRPDGAKLRSSRELHGCPKLSASQHPGVRFRARTRTGSHASANGRERDGSCGEAACRSPAGAQFRSVSRGDRTYGPWPAPGGTSAALSSLSEGGVGLLEWDETRCSHAVTRRTPAQVFLGFRKFLIRPRVHYARVPKGVGSADICRELVKRFTVSELKCVQDYGLGKFEVTFANDEASRRFSDDPVLAIRDARIRFQDRGVRVKVVRVIGFPADADVRIITQLLARFGKCKARTTSSAAPPVASSSSQEQVSGVAEDREAVPGDAEGSTQPQPEPISERAPGGEEQEAGSELAEAPHPLCCRRAVAGLACRCARRQPC